MHKKYMKKISGWVMPSLLAATMLVGILAVIPLSTHAFGF